MSSNSQILVIYIAAMLVLFVSWALRPFRMAAKSPSAFVGWLTLVWLLSWFLGMLVSLLAIVVSGSANVSLPWVYVFVISFGGVALASALLLVVGEMIRTARAVVKSSPH